LEIFGKRRRVRGEYNELPGTSDEALGRLARIPYTYPVVDIATILTNPFSLPELRIYFLFRCLACSGLLVSKDIQTGSTGRNATTGKGGRARNNGGPSGKTLSRRREAQQGEKDTGEKGLHDGNVEVLLGWQSKQ
jgi:hypothetical protein